MNVLPINPDNDISRDLLQIGSWVRHSFGRLPYCPPYLVLGRPVTRTPMFPASERYGRVGYFLLGYTPPEDSP